MPSGLAATDGGGRALRPPVDTCPRARSAQPRRRSAPTGPDRGDRAAAAESRFESCAWPEEAEPSIACCGPPPFKWAAGGSGGDQEDAFATLAPRLSGVRLAP